MSVFLSFAYVRAKATTYSQHHYVAVLAARVEIVLTAVDVVCSIVCA